MISSTITLVPTSSILVNWEERYPKSSLDEDHITNLAADIARRDLIHTILIEKDSLRLLAGGHRLRAFLLNASKNLPDKNHEYKNWSLIPARLAYDIQPGEAAHIELVENIQHRVLRWDIRAEAVAKIHATEASSHSSWDAEKTASLLGCKHTEVLRSVRVTPRLNSPILGTNLRDCPSLNSAFNIVMRADDREKSTQLEILLGKGKEVLTLQPIPPKNPPIPPKNPPLPTPAGVIRPAPTPIPTPIILTDFADFLQSYSGPRFNLLHCDPPYGINADTHNGMRTRKDTLKYSDNPDEYFSFLSLLSKFASLHMAASSHIMLWYSPNMRRATWEFLDEHFLDWTLQEWDMIWFCSDNSGLLPDSQRYGRRNYETALLLTRGDRHITRPVSLCFPYPKKSSQRIHQSEKPFEVSRHFLSMLIDEHTICLDPTAGSGRPLQAAFSLGARSVLGLERDPTIHQLASTSWEKFILDGEAP